MTALERRLIYMAMISAAGHGLDLERPVAATVDAVITSVSGEPPQPPPAFEND
jgi:hypothetical protein